MTDDGRESPVHERSRGKVRPRIELARPKSEQTSTSLAPRPCKIALPSGVVHAILSHGLTQVTVAFAVDPVPMIPGMRHHSVGRAFHEDNPKNFVWAPPFRAAPEVLGTVSPLDIGDEVFVIEQFKVLDAHGRKVVVYEDGSAAAIDPATPCVGGLWGMPESASRLSLRITSKATPVLLSNLHDLTLLIAQERYVDMHMKLWEHLRRDPTSVGNLKSNLWMFQVDARVSYARPLGWIHGWNPEAS